MKFPFRRFSPIVALVALVALAPVVSSTLVHAGQNVASANWAGHDAVTASPSLHNPAFDNTRWYEFHTRYQSSYPSGVWVPAGTDLSDRTQDWRLWFLDGTDVVDCDPDDKYKHSGTESAKVRSFSWSSKNRQVAGLYQVIENIAPCRTYQFQMYGWSKQNEASDWLAALRVGIEPNGWHPDSANDPAVHGDWPDATVWGDSHKYTSGFGPLAVTAEALDTEIVVFLYADAHGGNSHTIYWDTGSFQAGIPPDLLSDPDNPTVNTSGISSGPAVAVGKTSATVNWNTGTTDASEQVYYRLVSGPSSPPPSTETLTYTIYLPLINRSPGPWLFTDMDDTFDDSHNVLVSDLQPDSTYEYFVASRGFSNAECVTWISDIKEFKTTK